MLKKCTKFGFSFAETTITRCILSVTAVALITIAGANQASAVPLADAATPTGDVTIEDIGNAGDECRAECRRQELVDSLACGQAAQSCLQGIIYLPWPIWISAQSICHSNLSICESAASVKASSCIVACSNMQVDLLNHTTAQVSE